VRDADAFTRFREKGIFSREVGGEFRERILSKSDSEDPAELYRQFMGREPDPRAPAAVGSGVDQRFYPEPLGSGYMSRSFIG
jgi:hypothetical protein